MKVLLTGAAGFIGQHIAAALREAGHEVVGADLRLEQAHGVGTALPDGVVRADIADRDAIAPLLRGVDVVCHQAAMVGNGVDAYDLPDYARHNDYATAVLLAELARAEVGKLVLASSMVVYGDGSYRCERDGVVAPAVRRETDLAQRRFDPRCGMCDGPVEWCEVEEDAPILPRTGYAASKVAQENFAAAWCTLEGAHCVALRYHNVYGPGMPADTPYSGVAAIFRSALARGEAPRVFEDGRQTRDFVHVTDVARANVAAVESVGAGEPGLKPYNVCSGFPYTIGSMARRLAEVSGGPEPVVTGDYRAYDVRHVVASPARARIGLEFEARIHPDHGIAELATAPLRR